jgi:hypothetical protein
VRIGVVLVYWPDGTPLPHDECPMAIALRQKEAVRGVEAVAQRSDGTRISHARRISEPMSKGILIVAD